jgi:transposase-like protein
VARAKVSPDIRAAALADLHAGEQPAAVAERYGLDSATVRVWKQRYVTTPGALDVTPVTTVVTAPESGDHRTFGELVFDLLRAKLRASEAIARAAEDADWIKRQTGADVAALGQWLDASAFAIGDRLAGRPQQRDDDANGDNGA